jgi:hypothetical protein
MTEEEIEIVAEELAKIGGVAWYPGREKGSILRVVSDRYRDRARAAIEALDRFRASHQSVVVQDNANAIPHPVSRDEIKPGATVVYRPPGDRRAYPCRVVEIEGSKAYLTPIMIACTDWVSIEHLVPQPETERSAAQE